MGTASLANWGVAAFLAVIAVGCGSEPVGEWQSRNELPNGKRTELSLEEDGEGDLKMYVQVTKLGGLVRVDYDVDDWFVEADGAYEIQLACKKGCEAAETLNVNLDFEMDCEHDTDNEWLDCDAKSPWKGYGFFEFEVEPE